MLCSPASGLTLSLLQEQARRGEDWERELELRLQEDSLLFIHGVTKGGTIKDLA